MAPKTYPVPCGCGNVLQVALAAAGTTVPCGCGNPVEVPSQTALKASAGQTVVSADFEITQLAGTGRLPQEEDCVLCGRRTEHAASVFVECERVRDDDGGVRWWHALLVAGMILLTCLILPVGLILAYWWTRRRTERGGDVIFRLPIRVCEACAAGLRTADAVREAFARSPLYARLLEKYPNTRLSYTPPPA